MIYDDYYDWQQRGCGFINCMPSSGGGFGGFGFGKRWFCEPYRVPELPGKNENKDLENV